MTQSAHQVRREVGIRACCGSLRWALLEAVQALPAGVHVAALRWGPAEIPVDVEVGAVPAERAAAALLDAARRRLGPGASCYAGRGALLIEPAGDGAETAAGPRARTDLVSAGDEKARGKR